MLPFVEQEPAYRLFTNPLPGLNPHWGGVHDLSNTTFQATGALKTQVAAMLCPSSPRTTRNTTESVPGGGGFCGDYAVNVGDRTVSNSGPPDYQSTGPFPLAWGYTNPNGVVNSNPGLRFKDISDGLGKTVFIGEKHIPLDQFGKGPHDNTLFTAVSSVTPSGLNSSVRLCLPEGVALSPSDPSATANYFGSHHPEVLLFGFGDGRVETVSKSIAGSVLQLLGHRADGQVVPAY
jgi:hypothetical protein